ERAERGTDRTAAAAEDRNAADDHRGDHLKLVTGARAGVDGLVLRRPQHPGDSGDRAAHRERGEHPPADRDARQPGGFGAGSDRVQLPAGPERAQVVGAGPDHRGYHDRQVGEPSRGRPGDTGEARRESGRDDLVAAHDEDVRAAENVERGQRDDQAGHPADRDHETVHDPAPETDAQAREEHHHDGDAVRVAEQAGGQVRGQAEHRPDGQVHVAADHDHRLAEREQRENRGVEQDELDVDGADEPGLDAGRHGDEDRQDDDDAGFPDLEDALGDPSRAAHSLRDLLRLAGDDRLHRALASSWPVAAAMIFSSDASDWASSATRRPSRITRIRSLMCSTSGSSDEIIKIATPSRASSVSSRCTSALVAMSMPRVGSSTISTEGLRPSHLPSTTFCWLPPERLATGSVSLPYLRRSLAAQSDAYARSAAERMMPPWRSRASEASAMFCCTDMSMTSPCWWRSSGTNPIPAAMAAVGAALRSARSPTVTPPASYRSIPNTARATSVRLAPTSPDSATISPARTVKEMSVNTPSRVSRRTVSAGSPGWRRSAAVRCGISRPTIART